jgi:hypothetical protein
VKGGFTTSRAVTWGASVMMARFSIHPDDTSGEDCLMENDMMNQAGILAVRK